MQYFRSIQCNNKIYRVVINTFNEPFELQIVMRDKIFEPLSQTEKYGILHNYSLYRNGMQNTNIFFYNDV